MIAREYSLTLPSGAPPPATRPLITLRPAGAVELQLRRRRSVPPPKAVDAGDLFAC